MLGISLECQITIRHSLPSYPYALCAFSDHISLQKKLLILNFVSPSYLSNFFSACRPSLSIVLRISSLRGLIWHSNGFGRILNPFLILVSTSFLTPLPDSTLGFIRIGDNSRVIKNIYLDFPALRIHRLPNIKSPQQPRHANECPLLRQRLPHAHAPPPSKRHVPALTRKRARILTIFEEPLWHKRVWEREVPLVAVNSPKVALHPRIFRDQIALERPSSQGRCRRSVTGKGNGQYGL